MFSIIIFQTQDVSPDIWKITKMGKTGENTNPGNHYYCVFLAHQHKAAGVKIRLRKNNDHDGVSHGVECN